MEELKTEVVEQPVENAPTEVVAPKPLDKNTILREWSKENGD